MKKTNKLMIISMLLTAGWNTTNGQNVFPTGAGTSVGIGTNAPATRLQVIGGVSRFGSTTNYGQFADDGDLTFTGNGDYLVGGNKYAFRFSADQDYGIFFNQTNLRYEFRDAAAIPVFYTTTTGEGFFAKGVQIGNSILNNAGNIRWTGLDFEGFDGAIWRSLTATGIAPETDPQVGSNTTNFVPKWNGSSLITSSIFDNGSIGIGTSNPTVKLQVEGGTDSSPAAGGFIVTGSITSTNISIDNNEIMARNNGVVSNLFLNKSGGNLIQCVEDGYVGIGTASPLSKLDVVGSIRASGNLRVTGTIGFNSTESLLDGGSFTIASNSNIDHETDDLDGLGTSAKRWVDLWAVDGTINTSDAREKSNVKNLEYGIKDVMKLRPVSYTWIKNPERGTKLGLIAQELQEVIPEVVRDWERKADEKTGERKVVPSVRLGVMYDDIIPVLISGIQDQQRTIETKSTELEAVKLEVASLKEMISKMEVASNEVFLNNQISDGINTLNEEKAILEQNAPNPFREKTTINYYIPSNIKNAMVQIYSLNGDAIKTIKVNGTGKGSVEVNGGSFAAGTYTYQLILDGKTIDTKLMVITK